jgi:thioredoxin reductase
MFDAAIVGAGPAGLNATLMLGLCRRRVLVCDIGRPRNAASRHELQGLSVTDAKPHADGFEITLSALRARLRALGSDGYSSHSEIR